jgi:hypothetical protein
LTRRVAGDAHEPVRFVQPLGRDHPLAGVEADDAYAVGSRPVERDGEQLPAKPASALVGPQIHPLQLDGAAAQVAQRDRADDDTGGERDPQGDVRSARVVQIGVEFGVGLELELAQRVGDQRTEALGVRGFERNDRYGAVSSSTMNSKTER